jgi:hypothetical protein
VSARANAQQQARQQKAGRGGEGAGLHDAVEYKRLGGAQGQQLIARRRRNPQAASTRTPVPAAPPAQSHHAAASTPSLTTAAKCLRVRRACLLGSRQVELAIFADLGGLSARFFCGPSFVIDARAHEAPDAVTPDRRDCGADHLALDEIIMKRHLAIGSKVGIL